MSNVKIHFDPTGQVEQPTLVLARKSGEKIGVLTNLQGLMFADSMMNPSEFVFNVYKGTCSYWDEIKDFKIVWVADWDKWYEMSVELSESDATMKSVSLTHLPEAELAQIMLYNIEINTETDVSRKDYDSKNPTILYNPDLPSSSLLHRISEKAVNFKFGHIDATIAKIQRTFSFDETSLYDALQEIAEEIHCIFVFDSMTDPDTGEMLRIISAYDLESYCNDCGYRGEFHDVCPNCKGTNIQGGYGEDTTIFISMDNIANDIGYSTDIDSVKNCFRLKAGDDIMSDAIRSCNPNGTSYIWHITEESKEDMSSELVTKLTEYDKKYEDYYFTHETALSVTGFNALIEKYKKIDPTNENLKPINPPIVGYPALTEAYFNTMDMEMYLTHSLMPTIDMSDTTPEIQVEVLTRGLHKQAVSINNMNALSATVAKNAVEYYAEALIDPRYKVEVDEGYTLQGQKWFGSLTVTDYSDEEKTASTGTLEVNIDGNYENFVRQKIDKVLAKGEKKNYGIAGILKSDKLAEEMKKYGLKPLEGFRDSCQGCVDVLLDCGGFDKTTHEDIYNNISVKYSEKLQIIENEIKVRDSEIATVKALMKQVNDARTAIQKALDFEAFIGERLWKEFSAFRREDTYSNDNFISDGLSNADLMRKADEFLKQANNELFKSATLQHSITSTIKNLFTVKEFEPLREHFSVGNWMRIGVDDKVYKLRLLSYDVDFENRIDTPVTFSDVTVVRNGITDVASVLSDAKKMATSYSSTQHQASQGAESHSVLDGWTTRGLDATAVNIVNGSDNQTQVWDEHGMLFRRKEDFTDDYESEQLKILNSTIAITRDNWATVSTAIGKFYYEDPTTQKLVTAYGINGEVICGKLLIGEELQITNRNGSLRFDSNGFLVTDSQGNQNFKIDNNGNVSIRGTVTATSGTIGGWRIETDRLLSSGTGMSSNGSRFAFWAGETNGVQGASNTNAPFRVGHNGVLTAANANITGTITATTLTATQSGKISSWNFDSNAIYRGSNVIGASNGMYFGNNGLSIKNQFIVNSAGALTANGANITGAINATSLTAKEVYKIYVPSGNTVVEEAVIKAEKFDTQYRYINVGFVGHDGPRIQFSRSQSGADKTISITAGQLRIDSQVSIEIKGNINMTNYSINCSNITLGTNGITLHNRVMSTASGGANWRCTENGNLNPYLSNPNGTDVNVTSAGQQNIGNSNTYIKNMYYGGSLNKASDRRIKNDLGDLSISESLTILRGSQMKKFTYKTDDNAIIQYGVYAQDLRDLLASSKIGHIAALGIGLKDTDGEITKDLNYDENLVRYSVDYEQYIPPLVNGWKYHDEEIERLKQENQALKEQIQNILKLLQKCKTPT